ncbi:hypothetical protein PsYK624_172740 [Phanerochaete sordida]|uniref:Uncharacterized protein n=1 Tax=Phanerochaete sordida TaxID=48140 RepID=A0A9P3GZ30_9APHY|nr:hypothetical protein PsYK624_172740 [Phanerochaete sordida]
MFKTRSGSVYVRQTSAELPSFLRGAVEAELARLFDDDNEDNLDGWELESELDGSELGSFSIGSSPLTSLAPSPASSPSPSSAPSPSPSRASSPVPSPASPLAPQVGAKRKAPPSQHECTSTAQLDVTGAPEGSSKPKKVKTEADLLRQRKRNKGRNQKKKANSQPKDPREYKIPVHALKKKSDAGVITTEGSVAKSLHPSLPAYIGKNLGVGCRHPELEKQLKLGRELVEWDGTSTEVLADKFGQYFGVLLEYPDDEGWQESTAELLKAMVEARGKMKFEQKREERRGDFDTIAFGVSYGGGQTRPGNLKHSAHNRKIVEELLRNPHMERMAKHARTAFAVYFPDLYDEYAKTLGSLYDDNPLLRPLWNDCPWPAVSINFPPNSYSKIHTDFNNKSNGMCPVFALGDYDYTKGGHLVLPDLNLVIQFPPGCIIFIPSATLRHGNIPVGPEEVRSSWTLYASGGLFRWVDWGFKGEKALSKKEIRRVLAGQEKRWKNALKKFPHISPCREVYTELLRRAVASSPPPSPTPGPEENFQSMDLEEQEDGDARDLQQDLEDLNVEDSGLVIEIEEDFGDDGEEDDDEDDDEAEAGDEDGDNQEVENEDTMYF